MLLLSLMLLLLFFVVTILCIAIVYFVLCCLCCYYRCCSCSSVFLFKSTTSVQYRNIYICLLSYEIMKQCWEEKPEDRPTFEKLQKTFENMMLVDNPYLDFNGLDESKNYYNVPSFNSIPDDEGSDDEDIDIALMGEKNYEDMNRASSIPSNNSGIMTLLPEKKDAETSGEKEDCRKQIDNGEVKHPEIDDDKELKQLSLESLDSTADKGGLVSRNRKGTSNKYSEFPKGSRSFKDPMDVSSIDFEQMQFNLYRGRNSFAT